MPLLGSIIYSKASSLCCLLLAVVGGIYCGMQAKSKCAAVQLCTYDGIKVGLLYSNRLCDAKCIESDSALS